MQAVHTHVCTPRGRDPLPQDTRTAEGQQRGDVPTSTHTLCARTCSPTQNTSPTFGKDVNCPVRPFPQVSAPRLGDWGDGGGVRAPGEGSLPPPRLQRAEAEAGVGGLGLGSARGSGGALRGNPSAPVPWERRARPAPYVKNSAAAGTASRGCRGAGAPGLRGPGSVTGQGPGGGRRGDLRAGGPGAPVPFSESESQLAQPRALVVSPLIRAGVLSGATQPSGPQLEGPSPLGCEFEAPLAPPARRTPPRRRRANSAPTWLSWRRAARAFTSAWGGVRGPRPAAAGRSRLYHRRGAQPLRPVPPRRPGGGGAATPPRPAPPQRDSPGVPAPRPWPRRDSTQGSAGPPPHGLCLGWPCRGGGQERKEVGLDHLCTHSYPLQQWGAKNRLGSLLNVQNPRPHPGQIPQSGEGFGDLRFKQGPKRSWCRVHGLRFQKLSALHGRRINFGRRREGGGESRKPALGSSEYLIFASFTHSPNSRCSTLGS